ncbi:sensor histidine kinase [Rhodospira trueperi]|nr:HAMP domain-containing sensor histidine kinase [Rhodospira trueperi]
MIARTEAALQNGTVTPEDLAALLETHRKVVSRIDRLTRISDRQQLQLKDLNELKNQFVGMAAHDLRGPIALIQGFSTLLLSAPNLDEAQRTRYLETISTVSRDMADLLNDLLDISAIESGKLAIDASLERLDVLVLGRLDLLGSLAARKDISIRTDMAPVDVVLDAKRMSQVVDNLITNAIKYSHPGSMITVTVRADRDDARFVVADQGQGIPAEEIDKVFGTFQRLSVRPTGDEKSHGLGLAIARKIVAAHGGRITVDSVVGQGSTFTVCLPRGAAA